MTFIFFAIGLAALAFVAWEAAHLVRDRDASARRRLRMTRTSAKQKAWDLVFGRRTQKRLSFERKDQTED